MTLVRIYAGLQPVRGVFGVHYFVGQDYSSDLDQYWYGEYLMYIAISYRHDLIFRNVVAERMTFFEDRLMRYLRAPGAGGWFDILVGQLRVLVFFSLYLYGTMNRELFFNLPHG